MTRVVGPILVAGTGAIGSVVGGLLARGGLEVTLLGRRPHMQAIAEHGLLIDGLFGVHRATGMRCVAETGDLQGPYAAILLTVKAYDTAAMAAAVAPHLSAEGVLISMQNGLGNLEAAAAAVGATRVLGARVIFGAEVVGPGHVRVTVCADPVLIGSPDPARGELQVAAASWAQALTEVGVPAEPTETIIVALWAKVLYSAALNPLGALLGVAYGELAADPDTRAIMDEVVDEAFAVARAEGVELPWLDAAEYREEFYGRLLPATAGHRSSMLHDLEQGKRTEVDAINGYVVARAQAHGLPAPANAALTRLVRAQTRRRLEGKRGSV